MIYLKFAYMSTFMLNVLTTKQNKKAQEMFGDDEYVYNLIMMMTSWVCAYVQIHQIEYII